jgi:hypothetical protein
VSLIAIMSVVLVTSGFLIAAAISRRSIREASDEIQELITTEFAPLRRAHSICIFIIIGAMLLLPSYAWGIGFLYISVMATLSVLKLSKLPIPKSSRNAQFLSMLSVFVGFTAGAITSLWA